MYLSGLYRGSAFHGQLHPAIQVLSIGIVGYGTLTGVPGDGDRRARREADLFQKSCAVLGTSPGKRHSARFAAQRRAVPLDSDRNGLPAADLPDEKPELVTPPVGEARIVREEVDHQVACHRLERRLFHDRIVTRLSGRIRCPCRRW